MKYYPAFLDVRERPCVVMGGGRVAERKAIAVDARVLDTYVGAYELDGATITVLREGSGIAFRAPGQTTTTALLAESPTSFFVKGAPYTITFVSNDAGKVDQLVIEAGGQKQVAKKQ